MRAGMAAIKRECPVRRNPNRRSTPLCRPASSGEGEYTLSGDKAYRGHAVVDTTVQGKPERIEMQQSGQWISADCGAVKPR